MQKSEKDVKLPECLRNIDSVGLQQASSLQSKFNVRRALHYVLLVCQQVDVTKRHREQSEDLILARSGKLVTWQV